MRVAYIVPGFSASEEDPCIPALLALVREMSREVDLEVFALRYPHRRGSYRIQGAKVHAFGGGTATGAGRIPLLARALLSIVGAGRRGRFDVLHGFWADEPGFLAVTAGRILRVPAVVSLMGGELVGMRDIGYGAQLSPAGRWLVRASLRGANRITVGSRFLENLARDVVREEQLVCLPLGVDTDLFRPRVDTSGADPAHANPARVDREEIDPLPSGSPRLLSVGSLTPVKDPETLIRAFLSVVDRFPEAHLSIVGEGPLRSSLSDVAASLQLGSKVTLHGAVPRDRLPAYYRSADLCVVSSRFESQSMVALEAAACGCPVVGTDVGVISELNSGVPRVAPRDPEALAARILEAVSNWANRPPSVVGQERARAPDIAFSARVEAEYALRRTIPALLCEYARANASKRG